MAGERKAVAGESRERAQMCSLRSLGSEWIFLVLVFCVYMDTFPMELHSFVPNSMSPFLSCDSYSREISVRILLSKRALKVSAVYRWHSDWYG
jgi:hypothetical protein